MFNHLKTISRINTVFSLCLLLIACTACIEVNPAPPAPKIPTPKPSDILHIGIDPNLVSLQTVLSEQLKLSRNDGQMTLFVTGSSDTLQRQVAAGELDSIFTYQKPAAPGLWTMPVALDSIAVIAHPSLNLSSLTRSDLQQIFAGDIQSWQSISGQNRPVSVFVIGAESGTRELFNERVMENRPFVVSAVVPLNLNAMLEAVAQTEGGVGFLPTSVIGSNTSIQMVTVDNFFPQFNTVRSQQYPLTIPIYMATAEEPQGEMRKLAAWLQSADGQQSLSNRFVQIGN